MGRKKIGNLKGSKKRQSNFKRILRKTAILIGVLISIVSIFNITKYLEELYKGKDIENSKIEFYMEIADEASDKKVQISWKELLAIDMVIHSEDLTSIKKKDTLDIAKKFITKEKDKNNKYVYKIKKLDTLLSELNFTDEQKNKTEKYMKDLEYVFLGNKDISKKDNKIIFIKNIEKIAIENYDNYKILPSITIGQSILESGWGQSELTKKSNNLFGIKADKRWSGEKVEILTSENFDDKVVAEFRSYKSIEDSVNDHGKFLYENKRYLNNGLFDATHYITQAQSLEDAGYSTIENEDGEKIYADMLIEVIKSYNLQLIDCKVERIDQ